MPLPTGITAEDLKHGFAESELEDATYRVGPHTKLDARYS